MQSIFVQVRGQYIIMQINEQNEQNANITQTDNFRKGQLMLISDTSPYLE